ncbi:MAG TPA: SDR family NAD(P)-dependent oxidoreductase [Roseiflexaceae bacterium]|nr:SDR family NAD(P)-dependent oxidoreductase [Roseiflexaceae bacterium]
MTEIRDTDIAVIGMAGRFPGAPNLDAFWRNICGGVESIASFSPQELLEAGVDPALVDRPDYVPAAAILDDVEHFDAAFFGYSPREAAILDPQHRLFLECAWQALEHAGYAAPTYDGAISVYAGAGMNSYLLEHLYPNRAELAATGDLFQVQLGNDKDHLATKVSFKLNLKGPSLAVQTACSTSLVAIHLACQNLLNGESDMALAGGVAVALPQKNGYLYREGMILSPDGHCRAFDSRARGTVGGSGAGAVVLKRLGQALADGDTVYAVVRGSAINNDGAVKIGYTAPSAEGQRAVIAEALAVADVDPDTVTLVEAHGTGTPLGDPIEVAALTQAFRRSTDRRGYCALGSVKTNVGHLDAAAGVCGFIKAVLALHHGVLPPSLHYETPNLQIDFASSPFFVNTAAAPWDTGDLPRRAGVSSFGIGGTNAHVVLEQAPPPEPAAAPPPDQLLVLSAKTATALDAATQGLVDYLRDRPEINMADAAYTLQIGRAAMPYRRALVCRSRADLLARWGTGQPLPAAHVPDTGAPEVVFLFPGQGAQHGGMAAGLYADEPVFRRHLDRCATLLLPHLGTDIRTLIFEGPEQESTKDMKDTNGSGHKNGEPRTKNQESGHTVQDAEVQVSSLKPQASSLTETRFAQPALFAVEYALAQLWMDWGVRPAAMIGHSVGEYVAACLAGVLSLEDALALVAERGRLMQALPPGAMLSVPLSEAALRPLLAADLALAASNGPEQSVVAGPRPAVAALAERLAAQGVAARELHTSHAFHSPMMRPAQEPFARRVAGARLRPPQIPFLSNITGTWITPDQATDPRYWARQLTETVRFGEGLAVLLQTPGQVLLEVGPGRTLTALATHHPARAPEQPALASLPHPRDPQPDRACLLGALAQLWLAGVPVDWERHSDPATRRRVALPTYPFERQRFWIAPRRDSAPAAEPATPAKHPDLAAWFYTPSWKRTPPPAPVAAAPARWLVFADPHGLGRALSERLRAGGHRVVTVTPGQQYERLDAGSYRLDPLCAGDYARLFDQLAQDGPPQRIAHLWHCGPLAGGGFDPANQTLCFDSMLLLAQALGARLLTEPVELVTVLSGLADVAGDEPLYPERALLLGPCTVLAQEFPHKRSRCVDVLLPHGDSQALARLCEQLLAELLTPSDERLVAYRGPHRWVQIYEPTRVEPPAAPAAGLRPQGTYLITGGLGGIGLTLAQHLAQTVQARLILVGRTALPPRDAWDAWRADHGGDMSQKLALLEQLEQGGAQLEIAAADVADPAAMRAVVERARARFGRIDGIIHAAGLPGESTIQRKTPEEAARVLAAKVAGTLVLDQIVREEPPDFLVLCSSLRAVIGGAGHVDYCAANAFLDAYAGARSRWPQPTRVIAIGWDGWRDVGMAVDAVRRRGLGQESFDASMTPAEGVTVFERVLARGLPQVLVSTTPLVSQIERERQMSGFDRAAPAPAARPVAHPRPSLSTAYAPPSSEAERILAAIWQEAFGIEQVGIHDNFFELGGDSIVGILTTAKAHQHGLRLHPGQVFEHQTIAALAPLAGTAAPLVAPQGLASGPVALTPIQRWFFEQEQPAVNHFNQAVLLAVPRSLDPAHLEAALQQVLLQHDALRLRFAPGPDGWQQAHAPPDHAVPLARVDLSDCAPERQPDAIEAEAAALHTGLDITEGSLLRAALFRLGHGDSDRLLLVAHHLVVDVSSWRILLADLQAAAQQIARGEPVRLPPKTSSYQQWSERLAESARAASARAELDYWLNPARSPVAALPRDAAGGDNTLASADSLRAELSAEETARLLDEAPKAHHMQLHDLLVAALARALADWSGDPAVLIDIEAQGRDLALDGLDLSRTVGWCTAIYPALLDLSAATGPGALAMAVGRQLRAIPAGGLRYSALRYLCDDTGIRARLAAAPRAEVVFLHLGQIDAQSGDAGLFEPVDGPTGPGRSPLERRPYLLEISSAVSGGRLSVEWHYSRLFHSRATVERLAQDMLAALRGLAAHGQAQPPGGRSAADFPLAGIDDQKLAKIAALLGKGKHQRTEPCS